MHFSITSPQPQSGQVRLNIVAKWPDHLRFDAFGPMRIHLLQFTLQGEKVDIVLPRQEQWVQLWADDHQVLNPQMGVFLQPQELLALFFDTALPPPWRCYQDSIGKLGECHKPNHSIEVSEREGGQRRILITGEEFSAEAVVVERDNISQQDFDRMFEVHVPERFKKIYRR